MAGSFPQRFEPQREALEAAGWELRFYDAFAGGYWVWRKGAVVLYADLVGLVPDPAGWAAAHYDDAYREMMDKMASWQTNRQVH
jgi:hypothetical protein